MYGTHSTPAKRAVVDVTGRVRAAVEELDAAAAVLREGVSLEVLEKTSELVERCGEWGNILWSLNSDEILGAKGPLVDASAISEMDEAVERARRELREAELQDAVRVELLERTWRNMGEPSKTDNRTYALVLREGSWSDLGAGDGPRLIRQHSVAVSVAEDKAIVCGPAWLFAPSVLPFHTSREEVHILYSEELSSEAAGRKAAVLRAGLKIWNPDGSGVYQNYAAVDRAMCTIWTK